MKKNNIKIPNLICPHCHINSEVTLDIDEDYVVSLLYCECEHSLQIGRIIVFHHPTDELELVFVSNKHWSEGTVPERCVEIVEQFAFHVASSISE